MLDRVDSHANPAVTPPAAAPLPAWARAGNPPETEAEAAFLAGAALARLDAVVRQNPAWLGVWRNRLALGAAAASVARSGRGEDEAALRDAFHLTRPGADPGPAGRRLLAWRALTAASPARWRAQFERAAEALDVPSDEALSAAIEAAATCADGNRMAPFAAVRCYQLARRALAAGRVGAGEGELLATWLADTVFALKLKWPFALPLLGATRRAAGQRSAGEGEATQGLLFAYARGAAQAADLAAEFSRRVCAAVTKLATGAARFATAAE